MKIAVITGASSGMGRKFAETLSQYGSFDEVWAIARRRDRLDELAASLPYPVKPVALDLSDRNALAQYAELLDREKPVVGLLINASGFGKFGATLDIPLADQQNMVDLNCIALMSMCHMTVPYMPRGSQIINIASVGAFQPIPYINVYGASKAFVLRFSRALNKELRPRGIRVMAVCPFWTKTEFFDRAIDKGQETVVKKYAAMYTADEIISQAWRDAKKGKDVSKFGFIAKGQIALVQALPHSIIMDIWMKQQKLN